MTDHFVEAIRNKARAGPFRRGERVIKTTGDYTFEGEVIMVGTKRDGTTVRYVVEDDRGCCMIFNENQLQRLFVEENATHTLRDLASAIHRVAEEHFCFSQAAPAVANLCDHLNAMARIEEINHAAKDQM